MAIVGRVRQPASVAGVIDRRLLSAVVAHLFGLQLLLQHGDFALQVGNLDHQEFNLFVWRPSSQFNDSRIYCDRFTHNLTFPSSSPLKQK